MSHPSLEPLLSPEGWVHASAAPVDAADPGRFHALFGRDSLITALQVLPRQPEVAAATLRALAARQGRREDPETEEQPAGSCTRTGRSPPTGWSSWAGRCATERCATSAPRTRPRGSSCVLDATGDQGLAEELAAARAARRGMAGAGPGCRRRAGPLRAADVPRRPEPAGLARRARPGRPTPTEAGSCARTARHPERRWPTPTPRPSRSRRSTPWSASTRTAPMTGPRWRRDYAAGSRRRSDPT